MVVSEITTWEKKRIIQKAYEDCYGTQKYKDSNLKNTYEKVVLLIINNVIERVE